MSDTEFATHLIMMGDKYDSDLLRQVVSKMNIMIEENFYNEQPSLRLEALARSTLTRLR